MSFIRSKVWHWLFPFIILIFVFNSLWGKYELNNFFLFIFFLYFIKVIYEKYILNEEIIRFDYSDVIVFFILVIELYSFKNSIYQTNSIIALNELSLTFLFFYIVKYNLRYNYQVIIIIFMLWGLSLYLSYYTLYSYIMYILNLTNYHLNDSLSFKNLFRPAGIDINTWGSILLILAPFGMILYFYFDKLKLYYIKYIFLLSTSVYLLSIIVIASKGVLISSILFILLFSIIFIKKRKLLNYKIYKYIIVLFTIVLFFIVIMELFRIPIATSLKTNLLIAKTESQQRSIQGRIRAYKIGYEMVVEKKYSGIGSYNFGLYSYNKESKFDIFYVPNFLPFNHFIQLASEKGIIALGLYMILYLFVLIRAFKSINSKRTVFVNIVLIFVSITIICLLFRELTYSSIIINDDLRYAFWFFNALLLSHWAKTISFNIKHE